MGEIVAAAHTAHTPPLVLDEETMTMLSPDYRFTLGDGLHKIRAELDKTDADTFVIFDTHWLSVADLIVDGCPHHKGIYTSDEVPRGIRDMEYDYPGAPELGAAMERIGMETGLRVFNNTNANMTKHYATLNLLKYLHKGERVLSISTVQSAKFRHFVRFGELLRDAVAELDCKAAVFASGGMSHVFHDYDRIWDQPYASFRPEGVITPEAREMDERIISLWEQGDHAAVLDLYDEYRAHKPEGGFSHYVGMISALGGRGCRARGIKMSEYENNLGTGQVQVWFDLAGT